MEGFILDIAGLLFRWLHIITGIAWIGASFYFIWLDNSLDPPPNWKKQQGVQGDLWSFHGGGIYEVAKYKTGPTTLPEKMHWFYWEAYSTWITGMFLLFIVYYLQASSYLIAPDSPLNSPVLAVGASLLYILSGLLIYEVFLRMRLADRPLFFSVLVLYMLAFYSWLGVQLFSDRAAYIHVGILIGTIMVGNVLIGIIPPQRHFVRAIAAGREPDPQLLKMAKLRSTHNNYFTLPVLFCMISNHYPLLYGHRFNWLILIFIIAISGSARHFFNLKHRGISKPSILVVCGLLFFLLCGWLAWDTSRMNKALVNMETSDQQALAIVSTHCSVCHSPTPSFPGITAPPLGITFASRTQLEVMAEKARLAVSTNYMPLGNVTHMELTERQQLVSWLSKL